MRGTAPLWLVSLRHPWISAVTEDSRLLSYCVFCFLLNIFHFQSVIHFISVTQSYLTLFDPVDCSMPGFPVHLQLPELTQTCVWVGECHPIISSFVIPLSSRLQSFPTSGSFPVSQFFTSGGQSISISFSISPSNEHPGLISFRMDWLDLLAVQGTLKSLLQHHSSKASILRRSAFSTVQLWHPYMTTGKTIALTRWTFVGKVMSLLFNMLSRLVITFPSRSKCLLISWLRSPSAVIFEAKNIVCHCFHCYPIYLPWSDGTECHDLSFLNVEF